MHKEMEEKMRQICDMKEHLTDIVKMEINSDLKNVDTQELGEVVDMVKDLAMVEKYCWESCYYKSVIEAMEESEEDYEKYGYNNRRYSSGRYAPKGRGTASMGYVMPGIHNMPDEVFEDTFGMEPPYWHMPPMMGYTRSGGGNRSQSGTNYTGGSSGYNESTNGNPSSSQSGDRSGYMSMEDYDRMDRGDPRYGQAYNEYKNSRKHYTETHSETDKEEMDRHANEHVMDTMATIREIYKNADPELKKRIKADFTKLVGEMPT